MNKFLVAFILVVLATAGGAAYWFIFHERNQYSEFPPADYNFTENIDTFINDFAEDYRADNPESTLDVEAVLKQISDLSLIHAALRSYRIQHDGVYPISLEELKPEYTPSQLFEGGQIPRDQDGEPFDYRVSTDRMSYTLCSDDLENGGTECLESDGD